MKRNKPFALLLVAVLFLAGCSGPTALPSVSPSSALVTPAATATVQTPAPTATPEPPAPEVLSIDVALDPSVAAADIADPYAVMDRYAREVFRPDRELYNMLFHAVDIMEPSVDVSTFKLNRGQMLNMYNCLYSEAQYRFYYLKNAKLSGDGKKAVFTYNDDTPAEIKHNRETFEASLSHLLNNVAPEGYTDLQKVMAVYQYLCENANYSGDIEDETTRSPYGILVRGQGICNGFANLADYVLNRVGVPTEYVANEMHAWNIVTVEGKRYHMDLTFGVGPYGSMEDSLRTVLMDDKTRLESLKNNGADVGQIILGYPSDHTVAPPACTDTAMAAYNSIYSIYALDIDGGKVYYADEEGIKRMNLDCTGVETLATASPFIMDVYDGVVYYLGGDSAQLFRLNPDGTSELLDETKYFGYMKIVDGTLRYSQKYDGSDCRTIQLSGFDASAWDNSNAARLPAVSVPRSRSFAISVKFSEPMDRAAAWGDIVTLADREGNPLPSHLLWSQDGKTLTVRPKQCVADLGSVTLYVKGGAPSAAGGTLAKGCILSVDVKAGQ